DGAVLVVVAEGAEAEVGLEIPSPELELRAREDVAGQEPDEHVVELVQPLEQLADPRIEVRVLVLADLEGEELHVAPQALGAPRQDRALVDAGETHDLGDAFRIGHAREAKALDGAARLIRVAERAGEGDLRGDSVPEERAVDVEKDESHGGAGAHPQE